MFADAAERAVGLERTKGEQQFLLTSMRTEGTRRWDRNYRRTLWKWNRSWDRNVLDAQGTVRRPVWLTEEGQSKGERGEYR